MRPIFFPLLLLSLMCFYSCSTDFDINADKKDIAIVYGLLDQTDTVQYVKITRAFLCEGNALEMARDPESGSYGDELEVTVTQIHNGNETGTLTLQKTLVSGKDSGMFYYPQQEVYKFNFPNPAAVSNDSFRLRINNIYTGNVVTASTNMIHDFSITKPLYNPDNPQLGLVGPSLEYSIFEASWKSAKNGRIYEPLFRFHYREVNNTTHDTVNKYVDWHLSRVKSEKLDGGEVLFTNYNSEEFYRNIAARVPVDYNVSRLIGKVDFIISVGGDELSIYIDLNKPSTSVIQERPVYTNISNGLGIFSCRYTKKYSYNLTTFSKENLINGAYTSNLGFE